MREYWNDQPRLIKVALVLAAIGVLMDAVGLVGSIVAP